MKRILGLDLGTNSVGWALVNEAENNRETSSIVRLGVRLVPLGPQEEDNFIAGKATTINANRTLSRSMRRNSQRYKLRRTRLIRFFKDAQWITDGTRLYESGNGSTYETLRLRALAATERISLEELARVLLSINKKRGYKSNRKTDNAENEGESLSTDCLGIARELANQGITPGEYACRLIENGQKTVPDFYKSDLDDEFARIWKTQAEHYPNILTEPLYKSLKGETAKITTQLCFKNFGIVGKKRQGGKDEQTAETYRWRARAVHGQIGLEELAAVLQQLNDQIQKAGKYLGLISDHSKQLAIQGITIGQYLYSLVCNNRHTSLKNIVFYRHDYMAEFETIWNCQRKFYPDQLTDERKKELRDRIIFFQRPLRSKKSLIAYCELESHPITVTNADGKSRKCITGSKVCPKSSPFFQAFKIWQRLNDLRIDGSKPQLETLQHLCRELSIRETMKKKEVLKIVHGKDMNFTELEGDTTGARLFKAFREIALEAGCPEKELDAKDTEKAMQALCRTFDESGIDTRILDVSDMLAAKNFDHHPAYRLWHLLYSFEGDKSATGSDNLIARLCHNFGFNKEAAHILAKITFRPDYGSLSTKAIRRILPFMQQGDDYSVACQKAGYRHSQRSLTREELDNRPLKAHLDTLPRNSLRNPVVEKILNQMVHVVNAVTEAYGKPDEIRIELARELKNSAKERKQLSENNAERQKSNKGIMAILQKEFGIDNPTRNDILRYRLYQELDPNGYKTLYSNQFISREDLFSKDINIEHIIPQASRFDDSFSNLTLEFADVNLRKGKQTAYDFVASAYPDRLESYKALVDKLFEDQKISRAKHANLLMTGSEIPEGFIERDLRNTQYITRKACEILESFVRTVTTTTGSVTARLREDWGLVDIMKELNWDKYDQQGLTEIRTDRDGRRIKIIKDWTKRNDQRHHAVDALAVAFTRRAFVVYLNYLNARVDSGSEPTVTDLSQYSLYDIPPAERTPTVMAIQHKYMERNSRSDSGNSHYVFKKPFEGFRSKAREQLNSVLASYKAKNKVTTPNINKTKCHSKDDTPQNKNHEENKKCQATLTPRGQLHDDTIYGRILQYSKESEKVNHTFTAEKIVTVVNPEYRKALERRLAEYGGDPKLAFTGKNSLDKNPLYTDKQHTVRVPERVRTWSSVYTIRKPLETLADNRLSSDQALKIIGKVIDPKVRYILQQRLKEYDGDNKKAFSGLDENPVWLNREQGIAIKSVILRGIANATPLHHRRDRSGAITEDCSQTDFVSLGNNHHVAIFHDADGNLHEHIVSFFEAVECALHHQPIVDKDYNAALGWKFLFSMKKNEYFVFPNPSTGFDPESVDLCDPHNYAEISPNLFRVQKIASKNYVFRHHLETTVEEIKELRDITWKRIQTVNNLKGVVKVRIDHLGRILAVGEY